MRVSRGPYPDGSFGTSAEAASEVIIALSQFVTYLASQLREFVQTDLFGVVDGCLCQDNSQGYGAALGREVAISLIA